LVPVLDRKCVSCHKAGKADGGVILTGEPEGHYTVSYNAMVRHVPFADWGRRRGDFTVINCEPTTVPGFFGARASGLMQKLVAGRHEGVCWPRPRSSG